MPIRTPEDFGAAIRRARKRQGMTQAELCELCGVSVTYLSELERGKATAELGKALHVAAMLGIDLTAKERS
ncbi:helix-turn-helix domain-containing protein [Olsenella sp. YH-ols2217]|uniref:Helix-turn-helix domain-containing protein n=1 Tax=Kribbibacterium absianum TaxID=3044210 RepID=A0ABT6ZMD0_9ACTN|nr:MULTISPECIES: helix-turn-helix domain-containing protein [unclassified Olsenella]MDJ1121946.1 helix-turn-helix domain-containing protein [Olsenella sp. YH-ols2216]MDJ1129954.1 helix-turn-helix domain-containing protein [Olsenella sp. YH-ols2217]